MTTFDALQAVWQTADDPAPAVGAADLDALRSEADRFDRTIRWRDWRETLAALAGAAFFARSFPTAPALDRVGIVLVVLGAVFVGVWMWRAQRRRPRVAPGAPTADALRIALERVEVQIHLLRSVTRWYTAPLLAGPVVIAVGGLAQGLAALPPIETAEHVARVGLFLLLGAAALGVIGAFGWFIHWLNQRAVDRELVPLRDRLADTLHALTASDLPATDTPSDA